MKTFENFLDNYQLSTSSFILKTEEDVKNFINNNSLSKILEFWKIFPEGMIEKNLKEKLNQDNLLFNEYEEITEKDIFNLISQQDSWFIAEAIFKNKVFSNNFEYFYKKIFYHFENIWINEKKVQSNFSYYLDHKSESQYFTSHFSDIDLNKEFIKGKLMTFIDKFCSEETSNYIHFLEGNYHYLIQENIPKLVCEEFSHIFKIDFLDYKNKDIIDFLTQHNDLAQIIIEKILESQEYDLIPQHFKKMNDNLLELCLNHSFENLDENIVNFLMKQLEHRKINKEKFFEFLPYMDYPYLNHLEKDCIFSDDEIDKILSHFSSADIINHSWLTTFEIQIKNYISKVNKTHIFSIIKKEDISLTLFPHDYFLDLFALKNFKFSSDYSVYNKDNFNKLTSLYGYEMLLDNYHFFDFFKEEDKKKPDLILKILRNFSPNESWETKKFLENIPKTILKDERIEDFLFENEHFEYINFKPLKNQVKLLKTFQNKDDYQISYLTKFINEDVKLFLEIHAKSPQTYYNILIHHLENEYVHQNIKINQPNKKNRTVGKKL